MRTRDRNFKRICFTKVQIIRILPQEDELGK